jgi:hypothetical protein
MARLHIFEIAPHLLGLPLRLAFLGFRLRHWGTLGGHPPKGESHAARVTRSAFGVVGGGTGSATTRHVTQTGKLLIVVGAVLIALGLFLYMGSRIGLGRLPGDVTWRGRNITVHVPLATSLLLSILLTLLVSLLLRSRR